MREARKTSAGMRSWMTDGDSNDADDSQNAFASGSNPLAARAAAGRSPLSLQDAAEAAEAEDEVSLLPSYQSTGGGARRGVGMGHTRRADADDDRAIRASLAAIRARGDGQQHGGGGRRRLSGASDRRASDEVGASGCSTLVDVP